MTKPEADQEVASLRELSADEVLAVSGGIWCDIYSGSASTAPYSPIPGGTNAGGACAPGHSFANMILDFYVF